MAIYWYNPEENQRLDWNTMNVSELTVATVEQLDTDSVILIHMGDVILHWSWLANADPQLPEVLNRLGAKIKDHQYGELVFFTGGVWNLADDGTPNSVGKIISTIFPGLHVCYYKCPNQVPVYAAGVFGDFVAEYHKSGGKLRARDFFSAQGRELITAFRLLAQVWVVGKEKIKLDDVLAEKAKEISDKQGFWAPVESDNDLHPKLKEALGREELLKGWPPHKPQDEDAAVLIKWAFPANL